MDVKITPLYGSVLEQNPVVGVKSPFITIPGTFQGQKSSLMIDKDKSKRR